MSDDWGPCGRHVDCDTRGRTPTRATHTEHEARARPAACRACHGPQVQGASDGGATLHARLRPTEIAFGRLCCRMLLAWRSNALTRAVSRPECGTVGREAVDKPRTRSSEQPGRQGGRLARNTGLGMRNPSK